MLEITGSLTCVHRWAGADTGRGAQAWHAPLLWASAGLWPFSPTWKAPSLLHPPAEGRAQPTELQPWASEERVCPLTVREAPQPTHFTDEETDAQRVGHMARVPEKGRGQRQDVWSRVCHLPRYLALEETDITIFQQVAQRSIFTRNLNCPKGAGRSPAPIGNSTGPPRGAPDAPMSVAALCPPRGTHVLASELVFRISERCLNEITQHIFQCLASFILLVRTTRGHQSAWLWLCRFCIILL